MSFKIQSFYHYLSSLLMVFAIVFSTAIHARQLGDVSLPDNVMLEGTDVMLQLNGMGYRTKFIFKIYVAALYTESRVHSRDAVQALTGPKRIVMHMIYGKVSSKRMAGAWNGGFEDNNSTEQLATLQSRLNAFNSFFPGLKEGDIVYLDFIPAIGTQVTINGVIKGSLEGADFYAALLDVWLGQAPADDGLKAAMLGIAKQ